MAATWGHIECKHEAYDRIFAETTYTMEMNFLTSIDGTRLAYEKHGSGPALILVGGGLDDGGENGQHIHHLMRHFTVFNYSRRGRGESGNTEPYAVQREVEDIAALVALSGNPCYLFGASSGGALVLEAAMAGISVDGLAVYEVPYFVDDFMVVVWREYREKLAVLLAEQNLDGALELFMRLAGSSDADIAGARQSEFWPSLRKLAPTLAHDAACLRDGRIPDAVSTIAHPSLVMTGTMLAPGMQELQESFFANAARALSEKLPKGTYRVLEGQSHRVDSGLLADNLHEFFNA